MQDLDMNTREAMSEAIAVLDAPGSQGVGRTMYLKTRWTKRSRLFGSQETPKQALRLPLYYAGLALGL